MGSDERWEESHMLMNLSVDKVEKFQYEFLKTSSLFSHSVLAFVVFPLVMDLILIPFHVFNKLS